MAEWTIRYRVGGKVVSENITADSRSDVFVLTTRRNVSVISCSPAAPAKRRFVSTPAIVYGCVAIVVIAVITFATILLCRKKPMLVENENIQATARIAEHKAELPSRESLPNEPQEDLSGRIKHVKHPVTGEDMVITQKVIKLLPNAGIIGKVYTNNVVKPPKKLFSTYSENYIVGLMRTQPGMPVVQTRLPKNFDEEFKARIADPVEILPDDTQEDIALKNQMHDLKRAMAGMIADGQSPSEIILQERKELNRLATMRTNAMKDLAKLRKDGASREDIQLYVEAANKLMDNYGIKHIKLPLEKINHISVE